MNGRLEEILSGMHTTSDSKVLDAGALSQTLPEDANVATTESETISPEILARARAEVNKYEFLEDVNSCRISERGMRLFTSETMKKHKFITVDVESSDTLRVVSIDITAELRRMILTRYTGTVSYAIVTPVNFEILQSKLLSSIISDLSTDTQINGGALGSDIVDLNAEGASKNEKLRKNIVIMAIQQRASDIQILRYGDHCLVRFRIDGDLVDGPQFKAFDTLDSLARGYGRDACSKDFNLNSNNTGRFSVSYNDRDIDVRLNTVPQHGGHPSINLRLLNINELNYEDLGLSTQTDAILNKQLQRSHGLIMLTGPCGTGKSSTAIACLKLLRMKNKNINTIEDPVEFDVPGLVQVDYNEGAGITFESEPEAFLRHDTDVLYIGEIRNFAVAEAACRSANTGHLTFSTLHTNTALSAIGRMTNLGIAPHVLSEALNVVIAQRLLKRVCQHCAEEITLPLDSSLREKYDLGTGDIKLSRGTGCQSCRGTGFYGRVAATEVFNTTSKEVRRAIEDGVANYELEELAIKHGYVPMIQDAIKKALAGITTFSEVDKLYYDEDSDDN